MLQNYCLKHSGILWNYWNTCLQYTGGHNYVWVIIVSFNFLLNVNLFSLGVWLKILEFSWHKINLKGNNLKKKKKKKKNSGCNILKINCNKNQTLLWIGHNCDHLCNMYIWNIKMFTYWGIQAKFHSTALVHHMWVPHEQGLLVDIQTSTCSSPCLPVCRGQLMGRYGRQMVYFEVLHILSLKKWQCILQYRDS